MIDSKVLKMYSNVYYNPNGDSFNLWYPVSDQTDGLTTLKFPCHSSTVGALVGRSWNRVKKLQKEFETRFDGFTIDVSHDRDVFSIVMPNICEGIEFITNGFGEEISIANNGIYVRPEFVARIIGTCGHNLRDIESGTGCKCTIWHEDNYFWVRFPSDVPLRTRQKAMFFINVRINQYADYMEDRLLESVAPSEVSVTDSEVSVAPSEVSMTDSEVSVAPSEVSMTDSEVSVAPSEVSIDGHVC